MSAGAGGGNTPHNPDRLLEAVIVAGVWVLILAVFAAACSWSLGS
jgi:hypothetical protein